MNSQQAKQFLQQVFTALVDPAFTVQEVAAFFSKDYQQNADGNLLNYEEFIQHAQVLKNTLISGKVTLEKVIAEGDRVASVHLVEAVKKNGQKVLMKVIAFYQIENGLITSVEELTHMIHGEAQDRDLGSRVSH
ncbi:nuclear transport factor 2 family protein [Yersinia kristensenii]|uniref:nuclear transport factor 2 family protein n=1 Tax=Yersinia kristensenii TaxID=28152 RepID=UPI0011A8711D|nr:nuclear transport factor 2 family protein [Yersinia kristensenii]